MSASDVSDDEHSPPALRHSEETAVENPPSHAVPDVGQRSKQLSEVPTAVRGEQPGYVLDEKPLGSKRLSDSGEFKEEAGSVACESSASAGDGEVLAGEPACEEVNIAGAAFPALLSSVGDSSVTGIDRPPCFGAKAAIAIRVGSSSVGAMSSLTFDPFAFVLPNLTDIAVDRDSWPVSGKDGTSVGVLFAEESVGESGPGEAEVEAADS